MKDPFFACFHVICAYGFILSTSCVLTPFLPFPQHFRFRSLEGLWRLLQRRLGILDHPSCVGPHFLREMPISSYEVVLVLRLLCFFRFIWALNIVWPICGLIVLMYGLGPILYSLVLWLWDEKTILRLCYILRIHM